MVKDFFIYLKSIFSNGYSLVLLVPDLFGIAEIYFGIELGLPGFIKSHIGIGAFLFLLIAGFNVWRKGKNEIDFEIKYEIEEIVPDLDKYINKAKEEISVLSSKIVDGEDSIFNPELFGGELIGFPTLKDKKHELENYIAEMNQIKEHSKKWKKIIFYIKNTGTLYDSNIRISANVQKGVILSDDELNYILKNPPEYPKDKKDSFVHLLGISDRDNLPPYRRKIGDWEYELQDLHIGTEVEIFHNGEGIIVESGYFEVDFLISSKNTNKVIKKNIKIEVE
ncbi:hypothetical protein KA057_01610 [Candidatus Gracilibacteria bacterium]|nr:hypothetical protein [Candidatus Gracilibacteria bacterium]